MSIETLCGIENELPVGIKGGLAQPGQTDLLMQHMIHELHKKVPSVICKDGGPTQGIMLYQGSRIYVEKPAPFLETAGAEVRTPREVIAYQRAAELHAISGLAEAARRVDLDPSRVMISRIVTDYTNKNFCGAHINVLCQTDPELLSTSLLPFLATCPWGKAGGLGASGFVLSHKAKAIETAVSKDTRGKRPIFNIKPEPLSGTGTHRIHCCCMDATMSDWGTYLMFGGLIVIVRMLDDGACVGPAMTLEDPVKTFRGLDTDLFGQSPVKLSCGLEVRPVDIQRYYLEAAEQYVAKQPNSWMTAFVEDWRTFHDKYEHEPAKLSDKLDPFIKLRLYGNILRKHGLDFEEFSKWCFAISILVEQLDESSLSQCCSRESYRDRLPFVPFHLLDDHLSRSDLSWSRLPDALELWWSLRATDMDYHSVLEDGLFWRLRKKGIIRDQMVSDASIQEAMKNPPRDTRANARGMAILELASQKGATADWNYVRSERMKMLLPDPLSADGTWELEKQTAKKGAIR